MEKCRQKISNIDFNPRTPRGVRRLAPVCSRYLQNFNPRTPRGVRPYNYLKLRTSVFISIRAPLAGCDIQTDNGGEFTNPFQSAHPSRGATRNDLFDTISTEISIRAPLAGCDKNMIIACEDFKINFNPRTPRGVRLGVQTRLPIVYDFNPRTPRGVRPYAESPGSVSKHFNPRTPRGVRP